MKESNTLNVWLRDSALHARRRIRLLMLLEAADYSGISPLPRARLHAFAFLSEVLSPVFSVPALTGRLLKRGQAPYFPDLQWDIDRLVGSGLVEVSSLAAVVEDSEAGFTADFALRRDRASAILDTIYSDPHFFSLRDLLRELASALGAIEEMHVDPATRADATWDHAPTGSIVDYGEWRAVNLSAKGAERLEKFAGEAWGHGGLALPPAAKLGLYVSYIRRSAND